MISTCLLSCYEFTVEKSIATMNFAPQMNPECHGDSNNTTFVGCQEGRCA